MVNETVGVVIIAHELFLHSGERLGFLALAGALMGLPFVLSADSKLQPPSKDLDKDRWSGLP